MFQVARRPLSLAEQFSIIWWRLIIYATRSLASFKQRASPVFWPLLPYLWLPMLALAGGIVIGWFIALA